MRLVAAPEAARDIEALHAYIARDSRQAADRFVRRLLSRLEKLASSPFPDMGRLGQESGVREIVHPPYVVLYAVDEARDELVVLSVVHGARRR